MSSEPSLPSSTLPPLSALQTLLKTNPPPAGSPHPIEQHHLALQIAHNLKHQHNWTSLRLHTHRSAQQDKTPLSRPLLSGIPPSRLYVHPDEQIALLQRQKDEQPNGGGASGTTALSNLKPEREWVLPSHLREKWSLRKFGEVFDGIGNVPSASDGVEILEEEVRGRTGRAGDGGGESEELGEWRGKMPTRVLLATADDDSTVVYYIVHDGVVKPRQN